MEKTLAVLLNYKFHPSIFTREVKYFECNRCGENETSWPLVDLEWRRVLRAIRLGRRPPAFADGSSVLSITLDFDKVGGAVSDQEVDPEGILDTEYPPVQFRYVCSFYCFADEICASRAYENDSLDEPYLQPYKRKDSRVELVEISSDIDGRIKRMPSSFEY